MAKPSNPSGGKSWRRGKSSPTSKRPGAGKGFTWAQKADRSYDHAKQRHRLRVAAWTLLLVGLLIGFIVWLTWSPRRTPFLVAAVTDYDAPLAPNAFAVEDIRRLEALHDEEILTCGTVDWQSTTLGMRHLRDKIDGAIPGGPDRNLVVIHLSMHGVVDGDNEPCLLPPGALPTDAGKWLRARDLLQFLFLDDRPDRLADNVNKLLILDCNRMDVNWGMGLLYNDFAERLRDVVEQARVPNLVVLNSTSPGEIGWVAPELDGSVFSVFLCQGLRGAADVEGSGNEDGEVSLRELHEYLATHVRQWVGATRVDVQVQGPMLWPEDADFPIVFAKSDEGTRLPSLAETDPRWKKIHDLWYRHAELKKQNPQRFHPVAWAEFQGKLLRLEQLVQAGGTYREEFDETSKYLVSLAGTLARPPEDSDPAAYSFPLARALRHLPTPEQSQAARAHLSAILTKKPKIKSEPKGDAAKKGDAKSANTKKPPKKQALSKPEAQPIKTQPPENYLAAASAAWDWCLQKSVSEAESRRKLLRFVTDSNRGHETDVVELLFLRMLDAHLDEPIWRNNESVVKRALTTRGLAEKAAAPNDERAFYWSKRAFATKRPDRDRREAEDLLFISAAQTGRVVDLFHKTIGKDGKGGTYGEATQLANEVANLFALRDRAFSEAPYFAQWQLARLHRACAPLDLRDVVVQTQRLAALLDEAAAHGQLTPEIRELGSSLDKKLAALQKAFDEECRNLETAGDDAETFTAIANVLAVPLVTGSQRRGLRESYLAILAKMSSAGTKFRVAASDKSDAPRQTAASDYLARLKPWAEHPALTILGREELDKKTPGADAITKTTEAKKEAKPDADERLRERLAEQGRETRRLLATVARESGTRLAVTKRLLVDNEGASKPAASIRMGRARADRLVRAAAPLFGGAASDVLETDPAVLLRKLDLHYLLLWQARRAIDDFWGPPPQEKICYFQRIANAYLKSAKELCPEDVALLGADVGVQALLARRAKAADSPVKPSNVKDLWVDLETRAAKHRLPVTVAKDIPSGKAALFVKEQNEKERGLIPLLSAEKHPQPDLRRIGVAVGSGPGSKGDPAGEYWLPIDDPARGRELDAVALFRGHVRRLGFLIQPAAGTETQWTRPNYPPPTVVVKGDARQQTSVVFILDCSGSMSRLVETKDGRSLPRLDVARDRLETVLYRLWKSKHRYQVGLIAYGHRVGWKGQYSDDRVVPDPRNPGKTKEAPPGFSLHPSEDVDRFLALGRFTESEWGFAKRKLDAVSPLGETPLYLAITEAIGELTDADPSDQCHIVAITDGANDQTGGAPSKKKTLRDVKSALDQHRAVHLDIVGIGLDPESDDDVKEFKDLTREPRHGFHHANDPSSLLEALEKSLGLCQYVVKTVPEGRDAETRPRGSLDLNATCDMPKPGDRPVPYVVALRDSETPAKTGVAVEGGEALELFLEDDRARGRRRLVHHRHDKNLEDSRDKIPARWCGKMPGGPNGDNGKLYVAAHLPDWEGNAAKFYLSVQNDDPSRFSPRPEEVWIRVTPILPGAESGTGVAYTFQDATYYDARHHRAAYPVPMLCCLAPDWPKAAKDARIDFCCKFEKTTPDREVTVASLRAQSPKLAEAPDVTFTVETRRGETSSEPYRVIVTERHATDDTLDSLKVTMSETPERIHRRRVPKTRTVRHTFFYKDSAATKIDDYRVEFTLRRRLLQGASKLPKPLEARLTRD